MEASVRHAAPEDTCYAFYLLCDGERVATRWYEKNPVARFEGPLPAGNYAALAFWRSPAGERVNRATPSVCSSAAM